MDKNLSLEEMRQLLIDLIYESDDERTCDGACDCDINERPETKCRTCVAGLVAEYEKKVKAKALEDYRRWVKECPECDDRLCDGMCIDCFIRAEKEKKND